MMFSLFRKQNSDAEAPVRRVGAVDHSAVARPFQLVTDSSGADTAPRIPATRAPVVATERRAPKIDQVRISEAAQNEAVVLSESERAFIDGLEQSEWRGVLNGFVATANSQWCVVADMAYNSVRVMATYQHSSSGPYLTLIRDLQAKHYVVEQQIVGTVSAIRHIYELNAKKNRSLISSGADADEQRYARLYDDLVAGGYKLGASDIHFELDKGHKSQVKLRIRGRLYHWKTFDYEMLFSALTSGYSSRTKQGTNSGGSFSIERGMSTMTRLKVDGVLVDARFSSLPTADGGDAVLRLIVNDPHAASNIWSLEQIGYAPSHCQQITMALAKNAGLVAIAGSTGSGKSKSLQTFMHILPRKEELKRVAVEDPTEYFMPGVRRFSIQRGPDDPEDVVRQKFLGTLRQQMRMDPDVIMIGEIRDKESGEIAAESVQTGHRVLTTIHGDGAPDVIARAAGRLIQMPEEVLAMRKFIAATMYQRLLPTLCSCKVHATSVLSPSHMYTLRTKFGLDPETMYCVNDDGCPHCRIAGLTGRAGTAGLTVCAEILTPNHAIRERIAHRDWNGMERLWRGTRVADFDNPDMTGKTAFEHALYKASIGLIDVRDIESEFESLESYEIFPKGTGQ